MKKLALLSAILLLLTACTGDVGVAEGEILIPSFDTPGGQARTAAAEVRDLVSQSVFPAEFGCPFAETVSSPVEGNLLEFDVNIREYKEGDVIARIDASELGYDRAGKQASADAAYSRYAASGSERDRLAWLIELEELAKIDYVIEKHTVKAPYDCVVILNEEHSLGEYIPAGLVLAVIARRSEAFVFIKGSPDGFAVGMAVDVTMGAFSYTARVVSCLSSAPAYSAAAIERLTIIKPDEGELEKIFEDTPGALSAGWATVYATLTEKLGVLTVPDAAVMSDANRSYCILLQNGERMRVAVETGDSINGYTVILSGLSEGDVVVF
ncbi:MAG: hypothetical protein LBI36_06940 [Oscillospiraceae bacterium]|jgi:hypothetical protein|nr:hypothetical protein [Oscillospiraceae bacterium]